MLRLDRVHAGDDGLEHFRGGVRARQSREDAHHRVRGPLYGLMRLERGLVAGAHRAKQHGGVRHGASCPGRRGAFAELQQRGRIVRGIHRERRHRLLRGDAKQKVLDVGGGEQALGVVHVTSHVTTGASTAPSALDSPDPKT
jgi:hypothetical protein